MDKSDKRIVFMGTPEIASFVLEALIKNNFNIVGVIAQPDREVGRKKILTPVPTKIIANKYNIPVYQPIKIRNDYEFLKEIKPDLIVTLAYGQIVPQVVLDIPLLGCINLHGSLLPKYRGAAPMQYALLNNEKETGFSLMRMEATMDSGEVYATKKVLISEEDNFSSLLEKMKICARDLILESLPDFLLGKLKGIKQDDSKATFSPTLKPEDERLNINETIEGIFNRIRALSDIPGAFLYIDDMKVKIFKAQIINNKSNTKCEIIKADKEGLYISFPKGTLSVLQLQKAGKNRMSYRDFINGNHNLVGQKVS